MRRWAAGPERSSFSVRSATRRAGPTSARASPSTARSAPIGRLQRPSTPLGSATEGSVLAPLAFPEPNLAIRYRGGSLGGGATEPGEREVPIAVRSAGRAVAARRSIPSLDPRSPAAASGRPHTAPGAGWGALFLRRATSSRRAALVLCATLPRFDPTYVRGVAPPPSPWCCSGARLWCSRRRIESRPSQRRVAAPGAMWRPGRRRGSSARRHGRVPCLVSADAGGRRGAASNRPPFAMPRTTLDVGGRGARSSRRGRSDLLLAVDREQPDLGGRIAAPRRRGSRPRRGDVDGDRHGQRRVLGLRLVPARPPPPAASSRCRRTRPFTTICGVNTMRSPRAPA